MEQLKVLVAALALREFTVDEISDLSGVNTSTVRSVLKRNAELFRRADARGDRDDVANSQRGRGRPANRWVVVDCEKVRRLVDEMGALPKFEPSYANVGADDWRLVAVSVAEDALAQVSDESDPELQVRLLRSARSSLFFAESGDSLSNNVPWWQTEDSLLAVRARGVDALVNLASLVPSQRGSSLDALSRTARRLAAAMLAVPDRAEATYFAPFFRYSRAPEDLRRCMHYPRQSRSRSISWQTTGRRLRSPTSVSVLAVYSRKPGPSPW